jgi:hypothetical protein
MRSRSRSLTGNAANNVRRDVGPHWLTRQVEATRRCPIGLPVGCHARTGARSPGSGWSSSGGLRSDAAGRPRRGTKPKGGEDLPRRRRWGAVTDSVAEQGLEADATVCCGVPPRSWQQDRDGRRCARQANGKRATAAVTRCGCYRGVSFEGCETRCGKVPLRRPCFGRRRDRLRKRSEPQDRQRDATSPQLRARRNPSRWCKTTRTERDFEAGSLGPRSRARKGTWLEWTREEHVDGGASAAAMRPGRATAAATQLHPPGSARRSRSVLARSWSRRGGPRRHPRPCSVPPSDREAGRDVSSRAGQTAFARGLPRACPARATGGGFHPRSSGGSRRPASAGLRGTAASLEGPPGDG